VRLGIKAKQIAGVSLIVGLTVVALGLLYLTWVARILVDETSNREELLAETIFQRTRNAVVGQADPWAAIAADGGLRDILNSSALTPNVAYAAICNVDGVVVAAWDRSLEGTQLKPVELLTTLAEKRGLALLFDIYSYSASAKRLEVRRSLTLGDAEFGTIRIGGYIQLVRVALVKELWSVGTIGLVALLIAVGVSAAFAQLLLRPIHVIRTGLTRLGQGEVGVRLDLPQQDEFGELGSFFNAVSAQLSADRTQGTGQPAGQAAASGPTDSETALLNYSRKLVALGRLTAGVAHEVKNPLNAMTIHLELLRQKLGGGGGTSRRRATTEGAGAEPPPPDMENALEHVRIISAEIQRLDQVMQGLLKFARSEDLKPQAISLSALVDEVVGVIRPECEAAKVAVVVAGVDRVPPITGDPTMLRQALLNLALNARQAMPNGGTLRIAAAARARGVEISVEDTGVGIKPEHLGRIFDLYFTTREKGSGIGLSMVYRTVHLHDGEIEVESTEGRGTTFRILLPQAS
jgi:signal transduction histidine kinase